MQLSVTRGKVLLDIHLPAKNIAIYKRDIEILDTELTEIAAKTVECRASGTSEEIKSIVEDYFRTHLTNCSLLFRDVVQLLGLFEMTTEASAFRLLLTTVNTNLCRRFHTDINDLRMLCTYSGPGTLWVPDAFVHEKAYQTGGRNEEIVIDKSQIQQAQAGDVVILKAPCIRRPNPFFIAAPPLKRKGKEGSC